MTPSLCYHKYYLKSMQFKIYLLLPFLQVLFVSAISRNLMNVK